MAETYRDLLVLICIGLLGWGLIRIERIYQYPFFMGAMFISFILPQAFALSENPGAVSSEALENVLLMSCLCAAACWIGYAIKPNPKWLAKLSIKADEHKLFQSGIVLMVVGYLSDALYNRTVEANNGQLSGTAATIFIFFVGTIYIALPIFIFQLLKQPNAINFTFTILAALVPLQNIIISGRRQPTMTLIVIVGLSLFLIRRYLPPRWAVITAVAMIAILVPLFAEIRGEFWSLLFNGQWQDILSLGQKAFENQQEGEILELRNAALIIDAVQHTGIYGYGTGWWDSIVFQYVPGQIVGYEFKKSLQFHIFDYKLLKDIYGYSLPTGLTITAVGDSFMEFGYFGCFVLALIGYIFKHLWISSVYHSSIFSRLLYMGLISPAMVGITHGIGRFWQDAIFQLICVSLVSYYARAKIYKFHS